MWNFNHIVAALPLTCIPEIIIFPSDSPSYAINSRKNRSEFIYRYREKEGGKRKG